MRRRASSARPERTRARHAEAADRNGRLRHAAAVTLKHLAAQLADAHDLPKSYAETLLGDTVALLSKHLVKGSKVRIVGLGIFQVKRREARMGRNPQTGEPVKIKASKKVTFRAGKELKEAV
jgi:DNA-binding protein HU-beta